LRLYSFLDPDHQQQRDIQLHGSGLQFLFLERDELYGFRCLYCILCRGKLARLRLYCLLEPEHKQQRYIQLDGSGLQFLFLERDELYRFGGLYRLICRGKLAGLRLHGYLEPDNQQ
jgi:hypothetical protein